MPESRQQDTTEEEDGYTTMGARLREAREFLGLSQEAVAEALSIPRASVSAIESGRRKVGSLELREFSRIYKRPIDWFYGSDSGPVEEDATVTALFRATSTLRQEDKEQVLRFAEFLKDSGQAPARGKRT
jgi:transcriptional regulator with XRE-family HTH domain